jgi:prepilin-type processing-associated H-X9-DG protein
VIEHPSTPCFVQQIGTAVPESSMDPKESVELFQQTCGDPRTARLLPRIVRLTGIEKRYLSALDPQIRPFGPEPLYRPISEQPHGPGMGARTAAFEKMSGPLVLRALSDIPAERLAEVETLVTASCTHASAPGLERSLLAQTPIRPSVQRWNLGFMGCSAGLAAVRLVHQMERRGGNALVVACELSSLHFQYTNDLDQLTANVLFADGAAAVLVSPRRTAVRIVACRCASLPKHADQMVWFADDHGLRLRLSQELPDTLAANVPGAVASFLDEQGTSIRRIDHWLVHPGGPQILDAVQQSLGLREDSLALSRSVLRSHGNMSSPTIFFILKALLETKVDGRCLAMAFGPGLTVEMVLMDINHGGL